MVREGAGFSQKSPAPDIFRSCGYPPGREDLQEYQLFPEIADPGNIPEVFISRANREAVQFCRGKYQPVRGSARELFLLIEPGMDGDIRCDRYDMAQPHHLADGNMPFLYRFLPGKKGHDLCQADNGSEHDVVTIDDISNVRAVFIEILDPGPGVNEERDADHPLPVRTALPRGMPRQPKVRCVSTCGTADR